MPTVIDTIHVMPNHAHQPQPTHVQTARPATQVLSQRLGTQRLSLPSPPRAANAARLPT